MTLTTHAAAGMLVAQWTNNPVMGFFVAVASHYVLDIFPHGDEFIYWRHVHNKKDRLAIIVATIDTSLLLAVVMTALLLQPQANASLMLAAALGGILPDLLITIHTQIRHTFHKQYAGLLGRCIKFIQLFLQNHYNVHMLFHNMMRTPIRFRSALYYQAIFLGWFLFYYLPQ